ncbi:MAG: hypothetical protein WCI27_10755 [Candidatus Omnitrophota bacterium]
MTKESIAVSLDQVSLPDKVRVDLNDFVAQLLDFYKGDLLSVILFGSAVTGDFVEKSSDINMLVIYSDLNIANLNTVAGFAKKWFSKRSFAPRFISKRNLTSSAPYFPIDMLEMKDAYVVLYGEDLLKDIVVDPKKLHGQLAYEIKAMRMRIKQQFWSSTGDVVRIKRILLERFTSIIHLSRSLLFLKKKATPVAHRKVMETACAEFGISKEFVEMMFNLKNDKVRLDGQKAVQAFTDMMDVIRIIDKNVDEVVL